MIYKVKSDTLVSDKYNRVVAPRSFDTPDFRNSYKAWVKRKTRIHRITERKRIQRVLNTIFKIAKQGMLEREGGVVLEGIGYFAMYMPLYRRFSPNYFRNGGVAYPYYQTNYYAYYPYLFTDVFGKSRIEGWSMQEGVSKGITLNLKKKAYKNYYNEIKVIYNGDSR